MIKPWAILLLNFVKCEPQEEFIEAEDFSKWRVPNVMQLGKIIKYVKKFGGNEENNGIFTNNGHFWNQNSINILN